MTKRDNRYVVAVAPVRYCLPNGQGFLAGATYDTEIDALMHAVAHEAGPIDASRARAVLLEAARAGLCILTVDLE